MVVPTPQRESVELANEAKDLPLHAVKRKQSLVFRLTNLIRKDPNDAVARVGLMFAAFHTGDRDKGIEQLRWLASRHESLDTAILDNIITKLVMIGDYQKAESVLSSLATRPERDHLIGADAGKDVLAALICGRADFAFRLAERAKQSALFLKTIENLQMQRILSTLGKVSRDTICYIACDLQVSYNIDFRVPGSVLYFIYRSADNFDERQRILGEFDLLWDKKLAEGGDHEVNIDDLITIDVMPLPVAEKVEE